MKNTGRNVFISEIVKFCFDYKVIHESVTEDELRQIIHNHIEDEAFIENLINTIILKARTCSYLEIERLKDLLIKLERVRLDLEYKDWEKAC